MVKSNLVYRVLYHIVWTPSIHKEYLRDGTIRIQTRPFAGEIGLTSHALRRALTRLEGMELVPSVELAHGSAWVQLPIVPPELCRERPVGRWREVPDIARDKDKCRRS